MICCEIAVTRPLIAPADQDDVQYCATHTSMHGSDDMLSLDYHAIYFSETLDYWTISPSNSQGIGCRWGSEQIKFDGISNHS